MAMGVSADSPEWVGAMLTLCAMREAEALEASVVRRNTIWVSRSTRRRGRVSWVIDGEVCLEWREGVSSQYTLDDFLRLYREVK